MDFDEFIDTAWNDHAERPQEVADRLADSLHEITAPAQFAPYARLVAHVYGEHLGHWKTGIDLLARLRSHPCWDGSPAPEAAVRRDIAALAYAADEGASLADLSTEDRVIVLASASAALAGRHAFRRAIGAYGEALGLAANGIADGSPALRALAVGGNNLAAALEEKPDRNTVETQGMIAAAEGGLRYWRRAGTWLEEERAEYRLAASLVAAGNSRAAVAHARRCVTICASNAAPAFERFFGHAVLAAALRGADAEAFAVARDQALALYEQLPDDEKPWCAQDLAALNREP